MNTLIVVYDESDKIKYKGMIDSSTAMSLDVGSSIEINKEILIIVRCKESLSVHGAEMHFYTEKLKPL
jgi:hypothetical protein